MITENPNSEHEEVPSKNEELKEQAHATDEAEKPTMDDNIPEESSAETPVEEEQHEQKPDAQQADSSAFHESSATEEIHEEEHHDDPSEADAIAALSLNSALNEMEKIINMPDSGAHYRKFGQLRDHAHHLISDDTEDKKHEFLASGGAEENFHFEHPLQAKLSSFSNLFREKQEEFHKKQEEEQAHNLAMRQSIIDRLRNLYTNTEPGTNLFKAIREIKQDWQNAGQVAKAEFKILSNNYFHHLNQFYEMLDMSKDYLEQEYAHNLEKRMHIIERAKELEKEPLVQKALNELQFLHKLWKEEAEPVSEEFREKTWEEFREISNRIHERKTELSAQIEAEQQKNLEKKNTIIEELKRLAAEETPNHTFWQNAIKKVEDLREEFLKTGSVPRKVSNQNWNDFKQHLRSFNNAKNDFYKNLKGKQQKNLEDKMMLIQTAKDNMSSEDWETVVPLFKKLQEEWKNIGHVPKNMTNKVWDEFREACNTFFNNYRSKNAATGDNWKDNYVRKRAILDLLKEINEENGSVEAIENIKTSWNTIGKVPKDKIGINTEFNKTLREKLKLFKINEYDLKEEGLSENQLTDKARKIKNQIADLEAEISTLENNLGFFSNPSRDNPLLKDTYAKIDEKKAHLESMKENLHHIISGE